MVWARPRFTAAAYASSPSAARAAETVDLTSGLPRSGAPRMVSAVPSSPAARSGSPDASTAAARHSTDDAAIGMSCAGGPVIRRTPDAADRSAASASPSATASQAADCSIRPSIMCIGPRRPPGGMTDRAASRQARAATGSPSRRATSMSTNRP